MNHITTVQPFTSFMQHPVQRHDLHHQHSGRLHRPVVLAGLAIALALLLAPRMTLAQAKGGNGVNGGIGSTTGTSGPAAPSSSVTLRPVGVNSNGSAAGTTAGTLRSVGTNVDGSSGISAPAPGTPAAGPGMPSANLPNFINRNPTYRSTLGMNTTPPVDPNNSSTRPTEAAATAPDGRDTLVTADPSRDSSTAR